MGRQFWTGGRQALRLLIAAVVSGSCGGQAAATAPVPIATPAPPASLEPTPAPTPNALATPESCPPLTRWSSKIHNIFLGSEQTPEPVAGGVVVIDSTPQFDGHACNAESDGCGGRNCEDPRGGLWTLLAGTSPTAVRENGYQFRIGPLRPGRHTWQVCPRPNAKDADGMLLLVGPDPCSEGTFLVP